MSRGLVFWILMILWLLSLLGAHLGIIPAGALVSTVILFILFALLGWQVFGPPIKG